MKQKKMDSTLFFSKTNDFLNLYLPEQIVRSRHTIKTYRDSLTVFRRYVTDQRKISLMKFRFSDCTHDLILDFLSYMNASGLSEATCNNRLAALRAYLWYASDCDISLQSAALTASKVPFMREPGKMREIIKPEDFAALLSAPPATKMGTRDRTIMILMYDSAIRISELLDLSLSSLSLKGNTPYIKVHGKGDKERIVSITAKTVQHLNKYIKLYHENGDRSRPLFYTVINGNLSKMSAGNVSRMIKKYAEQIRPEHPDLPKKIHCHIFRRTRATNLYQSGVDIELVSRILGHSSTQVTRIYASPSMEMIKNAMNAATGSIPEEEPLWSENEDEIARLCGLR